MKHELIQFFTTAVWAAVAQAALLVLWAVR